MNAITLDDVLDKTPKKVFTAKKITLKGYTKDEDTIIMDTVALFPDNLRHAFDQAARKLKNRKPQNISARYYYIIRGGKKKSPILTGSVAGFKQGKSTARVKGIFKREEPLKPLIVVIKQLLDLSAEDRKKVVELLKTLE